MFKNVRFRRPENTEIKYSSEIDYNSYLTDSIIANHKLHLSKTEGFLHLNFTEGPLSKHFDSVFIMTSPGENLESREQRYKLFELLSSIIKVNVTEIDELDIDLPFNSLYGQNLYLDTNVLSELADDSIISQRKDFSNHFQCKLIVHKEAYQELLNLKDKADTSSKKASAKGITSLQKLKNLNLIELKGDLPNSTSPVYHDDTLISLSKEGSIVITNDVDLQMRIQLNSNHAYSLQQIFSLLILSQNIHLMALKPQSTSDKVIEGVVEGGKILDFLIRKL